MTLGNLESIFQSQHCKLRKNTFRYIRDGIYSNLLLPTNRIVDVVSNFLSNTKEKSQQNQPLAFIVSKKLLTININKINNLVYFYYSHSIVAGGLLDTS
jgi:hypothetical protein